MIQKLKSKLQRSKSILNTSLYDPVLNQNIKFQARDIRGTNILSVHIMKSERIQKSSIKVESIEEICLYIDWRSHKIKDAYQIARIPL